MYKYEEGILFWFINKNNKADVLGLIRDYNDGCFIVGGPTGSHFTGHGENWRDKLREIRSKGFFNYELALKKCVVTKKWNPPRIKRDDQKIIEFLNLRENENLFTTKKKWILIRDVAQSLKTTLRFTLKILNMCAVRTKIKKYKGVFQKFVNVRDMKLGLTR